jgi:hypothetical protein
MWSSFAYSFTTVLVLPCTENRVIEPEQYLTSRHKGADVRLYNVVAREGGEEASKVARASTLVLALT